MAADAQFTLVAPNVVLASDTKSAELKSLTWKNAQGTWAPTEADVLIALTHLNSEQAVKEILACAEPNAKINESVKRIESSRYQVFGLVIGDHRKLLFDASPVQSSLDRFLPDLWRKEVVSIRVQDGGAAYWWALYDVESSRFVACNRRPD